MLDLMRKTTAYNKYLLIIKKNFFLRARVASKDDEMFMRKKKFRLEFSLKKKFVFLFEISPIL